MVDDIFALFLCLSGAIFNLLDIGSDLCALIYHEDHYRGLYEASYGSIIAAGVVQTIWMAYLIWIRNPHLMALPKQFRRFILIMSPTLLCPAILYFFLVGHKVRDIFTQMISIKKGNNKENADIENNNNKNNINNNNNYYNNNYNLRKKQSKILFDHVHNIKTNMKLQESIFESLPQVVVQLINIFWYPPSWLGYLSLTTSLVSCGWTLFSWMAKDRKA